MGQNAHLAILAAAVVGVGTGVGRADLILTPSDFVIAIDGVGNSFSSYPTSPTNEGPANAIDGTTAKYLNFGKRGSGFIVIPAAAAPLRSFQLTTANDFETRDPASFALFGTNAPIVSPDNSDGLGEAWTPIATGALALPPDRLTLGPIVDVVNNTAFNAYKLYFPHIKNAAATNSMQMAEVQFWDQASGAGNAILAPGQNIRAIDNPGSDSAYPAAESPQRVIDGNTTNKYLNFAREGTGLIVTPSQGPSILTSFQVWTANDFPSRDPASYEIWGTNDPITSVDNEMGDNEVWTLISSGALNLPDDRNVAGPMISFVNTDIYRSYKVIFPDNKGPDTGPGSANSIQFAELIFEGTVIPEPGTGMLALGGALVGLGLRRRSA